MAARWMNPRAERLVRLIAQEMCWSEERLLDQTERWVVQQAAERALQMIAQELEA